MISSRVAPFLYFLLWSTGSPVATMAWGTTPDGSSHRVGYGIATHHPLRASEYDDWEDEVQNEQRSSFDDFYHNIGKDIVTSEIFRKTMNRFDSLLWEQDDFEEIEWFDSFSLEEACGEECDEVCAIPEHYKSEKDEMIDIMAYLGIRRAAPLHVDQDWQ